MSDPMAFTIEGGHLLKYKGPDVVMVPKGVTKIGVGAFMGCGLTHVVIPEGVTEIEWMAFKNWENLTGVTIPNGVTEIGVEAFAGCTGLTHVIIPNSVTKLGKDAFAWCMNLTCVTISEGITKIEDRAFSGCESLTRVTIPEGVAEIGMGAFAGCTGLTNMIIPNSVTKIGKDAFCNCRDLTRVTIPEGVTEIGAQAFGSCHGLTSVIVPKSIKSLNQTRFSVFDGCKAALIAPHIPIEDIHPSDRPGACHGFAKLYVAGAKMDETIRAGYLQYIKNKRRTLYGEAVKREELLRLMLAEKLVPRDHIELLLEECEAWCNYDAKDAVLKYFDKLDAEYVRWANLMEAGNALDASDQKICSILQEQGPHEMVSLQTILPDMLDRLSKMNGRESRLPGMPMALPDLGPEIAGLNKQDLILLAARPGMGKTSLALSIALSIADAEEGTVAVFSLDASCEQLVTRLLSSVALVENTRLRAGPLWETDREKIAGAAAMLSRLDIRIDDSPRLSAADINAKCRRLDKLALVVVDYLQLICSDGDDGRGGENCRQKAAGLSWTLKTMAKELDVPVLCISQLGPVDGGRDNKRPMLEDLWESGVMPQAADVVMLLHREGYDNEGLEDRNIAKCIIAKNNRGETETVMLDWMPEYTRFSG